jgi:hypothetical protein
VRRSSESLNGVRLKLKRAWDQLDVLKTDIVAFLDREPYRPAIQFDPKTGRLTVRVLVANSPEPMWGVRVGEIVHNFRSALDHVVWELAGRPDARGSKTQFPIFETEAGFDDRGTRPFLKHVDQSAVALVRSEQPFYPGADGGIEASQSPLWHLKQLSDIDKHRTLHLTATTLVSYNLRLTVTKPFHVVDAVQHKGGPIAEDTILWTGILSGALEWPFQERETQAALDVEIAFEEDTPVTGTWGVFGTLAHIGNRTERVVRRIAENIFRTEL